MPSSTKPLATADPAVMPTWKTTPCSADAVSVAAPAGLHLRTASCVLTARTAKAAACSATAGWSRRCTAVEAWTATRAVISIGIPTRSATRSEASAARPPMMLQTTAAAPKTASVRLTPPPDMPISSRRNGSM